MKVVVAGASGLIGSALTAALRRDGHTVTRLVRRTPAAHDEIAWHPARAELDEQALRGADAVVNLCGAGIGDRRWTGSFKQELRDSRITPTDVLAAAVADAGVPVLVNASGAHFYGGATGDRPVDESAAGGTGFLAELCADWEAATAPAAAAGVRTVQLRTAVVMSPTGGMLARLRPLYRLGLGGRLGSGRQYLPWISLADEVGAIQFVLANPALSGPVNMAGPEPVTNAEFNRVFGRVLHRPAPFAVPAFALRALVGEFAGEGILHGPRVVPKALIDAGYRFRHPTLEAALVTAVGAR